jgi:hypothetical protein
MTSAIVAAATSFAASAQAATVAITADRDNTLFEDSTGSLSNGAGSYAFAGTDSNVGRRRALVHFSLALVPSNATITSVTLTMVVSKTISSGVGVDVRRLLADWGEGTSNSGGTPDGGGGNGASATAGDATWVHRFFPSVFWAQAGGDFAPVASATQVVGGFGTYSWSSPQLAADVQGWVSNPASNFGWILVGGEDVAQTAKRFNSRENADASTRPQLVVAFTAPQQVPAASPWFVVSLFAALAGLGAGDLRRKNRWS